MPVSAEFEEKFWRERLERCKVEMPAEYNPALIDPYRVNGVAQHVPGCKIIEVEHNTGTCECKLLDKISGIRGLLEDMRDSFCYKIGNLLYPKFDEETDPPNTPLENYIMHANELKHLEGRVRAQSEVSNRMWAALTQQERDDVLAGKYKDQLL